MTCPPWGNCPRGCLGTGLDNHFDYHIEDHLKFKFQGRLLSLAKNVFAFLTKVTKTN